MTGRDGPVVDQRNRVVLEAGRVLVERVLDPPRAVTTFTVDRLDDGRGCRVTIHTEWHRAG